MTLGQDRVRASFNPSADSDVDNIKGTVADLIDFCESKKNTESDGEVKRLWALAQTAFEDGAMWAVKAVTAPKPAAVDPPNPDGPQAA